MAIIACLCKSVVLLPKRTVHIQKVTNSISSRGKTTTVFLSLSPSPLNHETYTWCTLLRRRMWGMLYICTRIRRSSWTRRMWAVNLKCTALGHAKNASSDYHFMTFFIYTLPNYPIHNCFFQTNQINHPNKKSFLSIWFLHICKLGNSYSVEYYKRPLECGNTYLVVQYSCTVPKCTAYDTRRRLCCYQTCLTTQ
jgi:hypothetical protein